MRILVVEDEKRIADFLTRGLQGAGYAVDAAADGATGLHLIHATDYDLVILDLMLPDMDGLQVLEKIRNKKAGPPVLILSARGQVDDRVKGLELGADDYLTKPLLSSSCWRACVRCCAAASRRPRNCKSPISPSIACAAK